jgi:GNAT superfamily N-acetyltransferase
MSFMPPGVGQTSYRLAGVGAYWSRRAALLLGRLLARVTPQPALATGRATIKVRRARALGPLARVGLRLWVAWVHSWRTRWASFDWYVTHHTGGRIVSIAGVVDRAGMVDGVPTRLGLLGGVYTVPEDRGRGLGTDVVRRATQLMTHELRCDFGVLLCADRAVPFYQRLGWKRVANPMRFERFGRQRMVHGTVMVYECAGRPLPAGVIDVRGLPA